MIGGRVASRLSTGIHGRGHSLAVTALLVFGSLLLLVGNLLWAGLVGVSVVVLYVLRLVVRR